MNRQKSRASLKAPKSTKGRRKQLIAGPCKHLGDIREEAQDARFVRAVYNSAQAALGKPQVKRTCECHRCAKTT